MPYTLTQAASPDDVQVRQWSIGRSLTLKIAKAEVGIVGLVGDTGDIFGVHLGLEPKSAGEPAFEVSDAPAIADLLATHACRRGSVQIFGDIKPLTSGSNPAYAALAQAVLRYDPDMMTDDFQVCATYEAAIPNTIAITTSSITPD